MRLRIDWDIQCNKLDHAEIFSLSKWLKKVCNQESFLFPQKRSLTKKCTKGTAQGGTCRASNTYRKGCDQLNPFSGRTVCKWQFWLHENDFIWFYYIRPVKQSDCLPHMIYAFFLPKGENNYSKEKGIHELTETVNATNNIMQKIYFQKKCFKKLWINISSFKHKNIGSTKKNHRQRGPRGNMSCRCWLKEKAEIMTIKFREGLFADRSSSFTKTIQFFLPCRIRKRRFSLSSGKDRKLSFFR